MSLWHDNIDDNNDDEPYSAPSSCLIILLNRLCRLFTWFESVTHLLKQKVRVGVMWVLNVYPNIYPHAPST